MALSSDSVEERVVQSCLTDFQVMGMLHRVKMRPVVDLGFSLIFPQLASQNPIGWMQ